MRTQIKEIKNAYYLERLSNKALFERFKLTQSSAPLSNERVYELFNTYQHDSVFCEFCGVHLISNFVGKNAKTEIPNFELSIEKTSPLRVPSDSGFAYRKQKTKAILNEEHHKISFPFCTECEHQPVSFCKCINCSKVKAENNERIGADLLNRKTNSSTQSFDHLDIKGCLNLTRYLLKLTSINFKGFNNSQIRADQLNTEMLSELAKNSLLVLDTNSLKNSIRMLDTYRYSEFSWMHQYHPSINIDRAIDKVHKHSQKIVSQQHYLPEILSLWAELSLNESLSVLDHYCKIYSVRCGHTESITSTIKRSLKQVGLALTSRHIYSSVKSAANYLTELEQVERQCVGLIHRNLNFWLDDERAKNFNVSPFTRKGDTLNESLDVNIFSNMFLTPLKADYLNDPVNISSLDKIQIEISEE